MLTVKGTVKDLLRGDLSRLNKSISRRCLIPFLNEQFGAISSGERVLSIGAGGGVNQLLLATAEEIGFTAIQLDIDKTTDPDIVADLCGNMDEYAGRFTTVVMAEVLEHCYDPQAAVDNIWDLLVPGGKLILTVPFMLPVHEAPHDYFRYTRHGLAHLLREFSEVKIEESNTYFEGFAVLLVRFNQRKTRMGRILTFLTTITAFVVRPAALLLKRFDPRTAPTRYLVSARRGHAVDVQTPEFCA